MKDWRALWDYSDPDGSEGRFRAAANRSSGDLTVILETQIARCCGLRGEFELGREWLTDLRDSLAMVGPEAQGYYWLEWGRMFCSATHDRASLTPVAQREARAAFTRAFQIARDAGFDGLATDALHMMALTTNDPARQLEFNLATLAFIESSSDPVARAWEPALRNNIGCALHAAGRLEEALEQFGMALNRLLGGEIGAIRVAHWMVAWTLRGLQRHREALAIQLRLEREWDTDGRPDPYVYDELAALHAALGEVSAADEYRTKSQRLRSSD